MALFRCSYRSKVMEGNVSFNVIVPEQCIDDIPTVYLLHGIAGTEDDWIRFSAIERYAVENSIAVVMPAGAKSFYTDMKYGLKYYSFISGELMDYTRKMFRLSDKREKTFLAGLSMGGYGALKFALSLPDKYAACATISGVCDVAARFKGGAGNSIAAVAAWGEDYENTLPGSDDDNLELVRRFETNGKIKPWIFQACGTDDGLYENNISFKKYLEGRGFVTEYGECPGAHTWDVWDYFIPKVLEFFKRYMKENGIEENVDKAYTQPIVVKK